MFKLLAHLSQINTFEPSPWPRYKPRKTFLMITEVYTAALIDKMKGKSRKAGIRWEPRAFLTRYTEIKQEEFKAEVAGESERNERITTKHRRSLLDQMCTQHMEHAYASRRGRHAQKAVSAQMRTHRKLACVRIRGFQHL
ncbi:hypothetical protein PIB30_048070 [Stylosanthes scabra]|uniref:Uncharacterized protein n=1 Tax=Stylosanthes scabra TaxID=79078 RepID=A0ABU6UFM0_9FABA|nr:hypothetical protein [Stylosanthes scabra]